MKHYPFRDIIQHDKTFDSDLTPFLFDCYSFGQFRSPEKFRCCEKTFLHQSLNTELKLQFCYSSHLPRLRSRNTMILSSFGFLFEVLFRIILSSIIASNSVFKIACLFKSGWLITYMNYFEYNQYAFEFKLSEMF